VHYTGRPNSDWWAETLREPTTATLACDQRRCRHTLARMKVIDLNFRVSSRAAAVVALCLRSDLPPKASTCERRRERLRGHAAGVVVAATAISAAISVL